jgi:endoglucanase
MSNHGPNRRRIPNQIKDYLLYGLILALFLALPALILLGQQLRETPLEAQNESEITVGELKPEQLGRDVATTGFAINFANNEGNIFRDIFSYTDNSANGEAFNCLWSKDNVVIGNRSLILEAIPSAYGPKEWTCGEASSREPLGYGLYEATIKITESIGSVTSFNIYSHSGDEIDIELNSRNPREVEFNYWSGGVNSRGCIAPLNFDASAGFHKYAFLWRPDSITWYVDGQELWSTVYAETGRPVVAPAPMLLNFWMGSPQLKGWLGYLDPRDYDINRPIRSEFAALAFTPVEKL